MQFKIIRIIFILLVLITIVEIGYYFYYSKKNSSNILHRDNNNGLNTVTAQNVDTTKISNIENSSEVELSKDKKTADALLTQLKRTLDQYSSKILLESTRTDVYESTIKEIDFTEGQKNTVKYKVKLVLKFKPEEDFTIHLNDNDLTKTKVFLNENGNVSPYEFSSLKSGDKVRIEVITNMLEYFDKNTIQITITKLVERE